MSVALAIIGAILLLVAAVAVAEYRNMRGDDSGQALVLAIIATAFLSAMACTTLGVAVAAQHDSTRFQRDLQREWDGVQMVEGDPAPIIAPGQVAP